MLHYPEITLLDATVHRDLKCKAITHFGFAQERHWCPLAAGELLHVLKDYQIVFEGEAGAVPGLLLGLKEKQNHFVLERGGWATTHVPSALRFHPFTLVATSQLVLDEQVVHPAQRIHGGQGAPEALRLAFSSGSPLLSTTQGAALFQPDGSPTEFLLKLQGAIGALKQQLDAAAVLGQQLDKAGLLVAQPLQFRSGSALAVQIDGYRVVDEMRLRALPVTVLRELQQSGALELAFAQILSMGQLQAGHLSELASRIPRSMQPAEAQQAQAAPVPTPPAPQHDEESAPNPLKSLPAKARDRMAKAMQAEEQGRPEAAMEGYRQLVHQFPALTEPRFYLANLLMKRGELAAALAQTDRLLKLDKRNGRFHQLRAGIYIHMGEFEKALHEQEQATRLMPGNPLVRAGRSRMYLRLQRFAEGWDEFPWRMRQKSVEGKLPEFTIPPWQPGLDFKRLLLWREQGIGEDIFFGSMLGEAGRFAEVVYAVIDPRLLRLFERSLPAFRFITEESRLTQADFDAQMPLGNIGKYLRRSLADFEGHNGAYLKADPVKSGGLRTRLAVPGKKLIGLAWRSTKLDDGSLNTDKSLSLALLEPLLRMPDCEFVNLQYGQVQAEIDALAAATGIRIRNDHDVDLFMDMDGLAALAAACDAVVSTSSVTAQLVGSIGQQGWVLLPCGQGRIWFWHTGDGPNLWYPRLTQMSQPAPGDWEGAVRKTTEALKLALQEGRV